MTKIERALREGEYKEAEKLFREVIAKNPRDNAARLGLGYALLKMRQLGAAFDQAAAVVAVDPLSARAYTIASYALCGFANLGSLGIQIGVLSALAPSRARVIARIAGSAMVCGFISTLQAAGIAGMLV